MNTILKKKLGSRVRDYRKNAHLTQGELAQKIRLSVNMIGYIERGERFPSPETFEKLAEALSVNVADLFYFLPDGCENDLEKKATVLQLRDAIEAMPTSSIKIIVNMFSEANTLCEMEKLKKEVHS